eukprot:scaffold53619_cov63-Phaeocystis_antarctica.AAC.1
MPWACTVAEALSVGAPPRGAADKFGGYGTQRVRFGWLSDASMGEGGTRTRDAGVDSPKTRKLGARTQALTNLGSLYCNLLYGHCSTGRSRQSPPATWAQGVTAAQGAAAAAG